MQGFRKQQGVSVLGFLVAIVIIAIVIVLVIAYLAWAGSNSGGNGGRTVTAELWVGLDPEKPAPGEIAVICPGESATLVWGSDNADEASIAPGVGTVDLQGQQAVSPTSTTGYTLTATGDAGSAEDTAGVNVVTDDNSLFTKTLNAPPVDSETGLPVDLIWRGTMDPAFISGKIFVRQVKIIEAPSDWPTWEFRKTDAESGEQHSFNGTFDEFTAIASPFPAVGDWEAAPVGLGPDPVISAKGPLGIQVEFVCAN